VLDMWWPLDSYSAVMLWLIWASLSHPQHRLPVLTCADWW